MTSAERVGRGELRRERARGYTLVEVMVVVAMIGVMGAIAIAGYQKYVDWAQVADTKDIVNALAAGQAGYYADTRGYLGCSSDWDDANVYPMVPNSRKHHFHQTGHADYPCWRLLNPETVELTYMSFWTQADVAGAAYPTLAPGMAKETIDTAPPANRPWYIIIAVGDQNEDGNRSHFMTHSGQPSQIHIENQED